MWQAISEQSWGRKVKRGNVMSEEKERILKLVIAKDLYNEENENNGVDYAAEYQKQTGRDLETGKYVTQ